MEITLEKIELVKDRTGVSYKEAKDALEEANGSVVDAIINIEETINMSSQSKMGAQSAEAVDKIKEAVRKGNVSKIVVKKDDEVLLNLPVNIGIVGTVLAPWAAVAGVIAAFGTKCIIELVKDDGQIVDISEMVTDTVGDVVEKGSDFVDDVREKGADVFENVRNKTQDALNKVKNDDMECKCGTDVECDEDCTCGAKEKMEDAMDAAKEKMDDLKDAAEDKFDDLKDSAKEAAEDYIDKAEEKLDDLKDKL